MAFTLALVPSTHEAEDLVQETYTQAALHYESLRRDSNVKAWLFTIMRNLWFKQLRHARSGPEFVALDDVSVERWAFDATENPEHLCVRIWEREEIRAALERLSHSHREIIMLRDIEGFSYKEIAKVVNVAASSVGTLLARALGRFEAEFTKERHRNGTSG